MLFQKDANLKKKERRRAVLAIFLHLLNDNSRNQT